MQLKKALLLQFIRQLRVIYKNESLNFESLNF